MMQTRLRISVLGLFLHDREVLMIHQNTPPEPDCWDLPGGGLRAEESLMAGLVREVFEETGIQNFQVVRLLTVAEGFFPDPRDPSGQLHTLNLIYHCAIAPKPVKFYPDPIEIGSKGIQWLAIDQLKQEECSSRSWQALQVLGLESARTQPSRPS